VRADLENAILSYCSRKFGYYICLIFGIARLFLNLIAQLIEGLLQVGARTINREGQTIATWPDFAKGFHMTADLGFINFVDAVNNPFPGFDGATHLLGWDLFTSFGRRTVYANQHENLAACMILFQFSQPPYYVRWVWS
jgi:hypothetical protein